LAKSRGIIFAGGQLYLFFSVFVFFSRRKLEGGMDFFVSAVIKPACPSGLIVNLDSGRRHELMFTRAVVAQ